ncbi:hypothetical protein EVAR_4432_1 [Eumeta japonica]|uniref:Uncharacterized protein n=1 Tax=Eumeta variegata TaxID=151549 RepID=A0A4C1T0D5_EUMVA|nr:hypothetical protein EVAR_4432_1 [Eumeta japonica]
MFGHDRRDARSYHYGRNVGTSEPGTKINNDNRMTSTRIQIKQRQITCFKLIVLQAQRKNIFRDGKIYGSQNKKYVFYILHNLVASSPDVVIGEYRTRLAQIDIYLNRSFFLSYGYNDTDFPLKKAVKVIRGNRDAPGRVCRTAVPCTSPAFPATDPVPFPFNGRRRNSEQRYSHFRPCPSPPSGPPNDRIPFAHETAVTSTSRRANSV